jgi:hypothetical protein
VSLSGIDNMLVPEIGSVELIPGLGYDPRM